MGDEHDSLERENKYLLRIVGGVGSALLFVTISFLTFWISTVSDRATAVQSQLDRQWLATSTRTIELAAIDQRLNIIDETAKSNNARFFALDRDVNRLKNRLHLND